MGDPEVGRRESRGWPETWKAEEPLHGGQRTAGSISKRKRMDCVGEPSGAWTPAKRPGGPCEWAARDSPVGTPSAAW